MSNVNLLKDAVLDEAMLHDLCNRDWYRISFGSVAEWDVSIRYVLDENCFGYKPYGQFLVSEFSPEEYDFYVFDTNEMWEEDHNESICDDFFHLLLRTISVMTFILVTSCGRIRIPN